MIMCVLLCYPVSIHMSQLQATGRPISSFSLKVSNIKFERKGLIEAVQMLDALICRFYVLWAK